MGLILRRMCVCVFLFLTGTLTCDAAVPLAVLQPLSVQARDPRRDATPQTLPHLQLQNRDSHNAVRFTSNAEVSYAIPAGQSSFSGILVYAEVNAGQPRTDDDSANRLRVTVLLDDRPVFDTAMDDATPPLEFSFPIGDAHRLTFVSDQYYSWERFALVDAVFSDRQVEASHRFLPAPAGGYVDLMPFPRQGLFHVFRPGESVPLKIYVAGPASSAQVTIRLTPEQSAPAIPDSSITVSLHPSQGAIYEGEASWNVPAWCGPASLQLEELVNGRNVFQRKVRVAIAPEVNLAHVPDNTFGLHTSLAGFITLPDEFASLWGAKWDRMQVRWEIVESTPGHYDFSRNDTVVNSLLSQNIRILGVLGESSPAWVGTPGSGYVAAWSRFVEAAVRHYRGRIEHWDVFNEPDVKDEQSAWQADPEFDLKLLRSAIEIIHREDPKATAICCSPGTTAWLLYYKRLFDSGLLASIDAVSLHPYESTAPEEKDGVFNYEERLSALDELVRAYSRPKPIWSTESNWILGARGEPNVNAPDLDEHTQAEYVVRANLLSLSRSVPYFLHMPFYYFQHKQIHLDTLSAYANMAQLLSDASNVRCLIAGPQVFGFTWNTPKGLVTALWTVTGTATVALHGFQSGRALDFYGNSVDGDLTSFMVTAAPTFVLARSASGPSLRVLKSPPAPVWQDLKPIELWSRTAESRITALRDGIEVISQPSKYAYQLRSPTVSVQPNGCYLARVKINLKRGSVMLFAADKATDKRVGDAFYLAYVPDGSLHEAEIRFQTGTTQNIQLIVANANLSPTISQFEVLNPARIATCP